MDSKYGKTWDKHKGPYLCTSVTSAAILICFVQRRFCNREKKKILRDSLKTGESPTNCNFFFQCLLLQSMPVYSERDICLSLWCKKKMLLFIKDLWWGSKGFGGILLMMLRGWVAAVVTYVGLGLILSVRPVNYLLLDHWSICLHSEIRLALEANLFTSESFQSPLSEQIHSESK